MSTDHRGNQKCLALVSSSSLEVVYLGCLNVGEVGIGGRAEMSQKCFTWGCWGPEILAYWHGKAQWVGCVQSKDKVSNAPPWLTRPTHWCRSLTKTWDQLAFGSFQTSCPQDPKSCLWCRKTKQSFLGTDVLWSDGGGQRQDWGVLLILAFPALPCWTCCFHSRETSGVLPDVHTPESLQGINHPPPKKTTNNDETQWNLLASCSPIPVVIYETILQRIFTGSW